jgi:preprotein translocase subunit SecA
VGTVSIEKSERLSDLLTKKGVPHQILNAKLHEKEAGIISQAGRPGTVTVATNMAGRGVDILLGGKEPPKENKKEWEEWEKSHNQVIELGGLHVLGTERHEARRIDNQLRGRSGRQGDPGSSSFYVSLEDDIVRRFGGDRIKGFMEWAGMDEDTPIENRLVNRSIESSQVRVEGYHFDMRKHLVEYDDVVNKQREIIYNERRKLLGGADLKANILDMVRKEIENMVATYIPDERGVDPDLAGLLSDVGTIFTLPPEINADALSPLKPEQIEAKLIEQAEAIYEARESEMGADNMRMLERIVMLRIIDSLWIEHLTAMEHMRQGIGLMGVAQRDPLVAYKSRGHEQFQVLLDTIEHDVAHSIYHLTIKKQEAPKQEVTPMARVAPGGAGGAKKQLVKVGGGKVGRNDPCPCGSGKKYKKCCGK